MSWNYRLLAHETGDELYLQVHEVYYNERGDARSYTAKGVTVGSETIDGINFVLNAMKDATKKPIILANEFPKEIDYNVDEKIIDSKIDDLRKKAQFKYHDTPIEVIKYIEYLEKLKK